MTCPESSDCDVPGIIDAKKTVSSISSGTITTSQIGAGRSYDAQTLIPNTMQNLAIQSNIINVVVA